MKATRRMLVAGLMAAALAVTPTGLAVTAGGAALGPTASTAHARPVDGGLEAGTPVGPRRPGGVAVAREIVATPTGDSELDGLCRQAADLINEAYQESIDAGKAGDVQGSSEWADHRTDMLSRAQGWGCILKEA